jgi:hypothetical protein
MTDIKDRFAGLLADEPPSPEVLDHVVATGRRRLRRRTALLSVAGTAGTAAVTAAVVVPLALNDNASSRSTIHVGAEPPHVACTTYLTNFGGSRRSFKENVAGAVQEWRKAGHHGGFTVGRKKLRRGIEEVRICAGPQPGPIKNPVPKSTPLAGPRYDYTESPQDIAQRFGDRLAQLVDQAGRTIVFTRPFAQETSTLDAGHPSYYDGNVDVTTGHGTQGDVNVQVRHEVTTQVPFDGNCQQPNCVQTTLSDGSVLRTDVVNPSGGGQILTAELHRPNGVVVQAQESNYGFGPNAPVRTYGDQPLTLSQLTAVAEDAAFTF